MKTTVFLVFNLQSNGCKEDHYWQSNYHFELDVWYTYSQNLAFSSIDREASDEFFQ